MNRGLQLIVPLLGFCLSCRALAADRAVGQRKHATPTVVEMLYEGGLKPGWQDYGWAPRTLGPGPATLDLSAQGGWIVAHPGLTGSYGGVTFRFWAPVSWGDFLEVRLDDGTAQMFPPIAVRPDHRTPLGDSPGGDEVWISIDELNPNQLPFDRVVIRAHERVRTDSVRIDRLGLTAPGSAKSMRPLIASRNATLRIDCSSPGRAIKPTIYGVAFDAQRDTREPPWSLHPTARRWGGNPTSRYNWKLSTWNTASDWYFRNVQVGTPGSPAHQTFLDDDLHHQVASALTVPLLGWVSRDNASASFPRSGSEPQQQFDPDVANAGNGLGLDGKPIPSGPPSRTSVPWTPADLGRFVTSVREADRTRGRRSVDLYLLDNEPMLWDSTHRDVHPDPVGYDELLERTLTYGAAIRAADPEAVIAGPALWGWPAYFYSAIDAKAGFRARPDRAAHGGEPLLPWYLRQIHDYELRTGTRILDVLDVHFYPQGTNVRAGTGGGTDRDTNARRLRSTRALWDPTYVDESWIGDSVRLIPRVKEWIAANDPGLGISIGEWSFGDEDHQSGGLAVAEALGRFGQQGVDYAFYWTYPAPGTPAAWAFLAYRNFDGHGGHFLDTSLVTSAGDGTSLFASRDDSGGHLVAIALNLDPDHPVEATIDTSTCGTLKGQTFTYAGGPLGFGAGVAARSEPAGLHTTLPPYSITVFDLVRPVAGLSARRSAP